MSELKIGLMMLCPECETMMESMGYGDETCNDCGHVEYSESEEDFNKRIYGVDIPTKETEKYKTESLNDGEE